MSREESERIAAEKRQQARNLADPHVRGLLSGVNKAKECGLHAVGYLNSAYREDLALEASRLVVQLDEMAERCAGLLERFEEEENRNSVLQTKVFWEGPDDDRV